MRWFLLAFAIFLASPVRAGEQDPFEDAIARAKALASPAETADSTSGTRSDFKDNGTRSVSIPMNSDLGIGLQGQVLLIEGTYYFGRARRDGVYLGHGRGDVQVSDAYAWAEMFHGGYARQFSKTLSGGAGLRILGTGAVAGTYAEDETRIGPHAWAEVGAQRGPAVRAQGGPGGVGVSLHWRWKD